MKHNLNLTDTPIRRDGAGRYCLNDLHRAAGGAPRHTPGRFVITQTFRALSESISRNQDIANLPKAGIPAQAKPEFGPKTPFVSVPKVGTFVVKELVYAYAMWISADFYLQVITAYDALVTGQYVKPLTQAEKFWFSRRPHWQPIRSLVLDGLTYAQTGLGVGRSAGSVGRCIRRMIEVGLINPVEFIRLRYLPGTAERLVAANKQMCLNWGVAA